MKKGFLISLVLAVITLIIAVVYIMNTDGEIPTNWDINGEITSYGSKYMLLIFPMVSLILVPLMHFIPKIDPKGDNIEKSGPLMSIITLLIVALMLGIEITIIMAVEGGDIFDMVTVISIMLSLIFIVIGYYMPNIKPNYMLGIRTPWTLHSEEVWVKTHTAAKNWFIAAGLLFILCLFLEEPFNILVPIIFITVVAIGALVYSYIAYRDEKNRR